jgi:hypothetical protein
MNKFKGSLFFVVALGIAPLGHAWQTGRAQSVQESKTVTGLVRDIACPLQNTKSTTTSYSKDCIIQCFKAGSPLGILTADGTTFLPVTTTMPDTGQEQLKPYVGEIVEAKGKVFDRNGGHAIEITEIHKVAPSSSGK